jgi:hypothetical protein
MKLRKIIFNLSGLLAMAAVLGVSTLALATTYDTWAGPYDIKLTVTDQNPDGKLVKTTKYDTGALEMYILPNGGPAQDADGYYMRFIDSTKILKVGISQLEMVSTDIPGSKSMKIIGVGSGQFFEGGNPVGPAYVSLTGKVALDDLGNPMWIFTSLTMEGGSKNSGPNGAAYIWRSKLKLHLTKSVPDNS